MQWTSCSCRNKRQVDLCLLGLRQLDLCFFCGFLQTLSGHAVCSKINSVCSLELLHHPVDDALVPVVTTKVRVTVGALDFKHSITNFKNAYVECSTAKVEYQNGFVFASLFEAVGKCRSSWLVDNAQHFKTCNLSGFFCCRALCIIEICRHRNNCLRNAVAQICFGVALQFHEDARTDFLWRVLLAINVVALPVFAHVALHAAEGAVGVGDGLALGHFTY